MQKIIALLLLVIVLIGIGLAWDGYQTSQGEPAKFFTEYNLGNVGRRAALVGIYAIGASIVIITGGIDLSLGSMVALTGFLTTLFLKDWGWSALPMLAVVSAVGLGVGLIHSCLIHFSKLQPFVVTLCGLLAYRGYARVISGDRTGSFGPENSEFISWLTRGKLLGLPVPVWLVLILGIIVQLFLWRTIWGRYIYAIGNNEEASHYSGISIFKTKAIAYMICSLLGALSGVLEASDVGSVSPSGAGVFYELYAIAAAVLGGCSLRGGEGTILGVLLGALAITLIKNLTNVLQIPSQWEYVVLAKVILLAALTDSLLLRFKNRRLQRRAT